MAKKSKDAETETLSGDILDLIWTKVINLDPAGAWLDEALKKFTGAPEPLQTALPAIKRLLATKASREDLGRLARMERYERCFGLLYEFDDPGLKSGKLTGLREQLLNPSARGRKEKEFMAALWEGIGEVEVGSATLSDQIPDVPEKNEPFGDVRPAVGRLFKAGVKPGDLDLISRWQRFDATVELLRLFERVGITEAEEVMLHESILSAEPSGKEARPGSWPVLKEQPQKSSLIADPTQPFLVLKSVEGFGFTPDNHGLVIVPKGGNFRIVDFPSGQERAALEPKGRLNGWEFSDDGKRIFITAEPNHIYTCDAADGKVLHHFKWPQKTRNVALFKVAGKDQFLVQTASPDGIQYFQFDVHARTVGAYVPLREKTTAYRFEWRADGRALFTHLSTGAGSDLKLHAWSWPELELLWVATPPDGIPWHTASSPDGRFIAMSSMSGEIAILSAVNGERLATLKQDKQSNRVAFAPDNRHLAAGEHGTGKSASGILSLNGSGASLTPALVTVSAFASLPMAEFWARPDTGSRCSGVLTISPEATE
jgi:hypothetical protein